MQIHSNKSIDINGKYFSIPKLLLKQDNKNISNGIINEALIFNKNLIVSNFLDGKIIKIPRSRFTLEKYYN